MKRLTLTEVDRRLLKMNMRRIGPYLGNGVPTCAAPRFFVGTGQVQRRIIS